MVVDVERVRAILGLAHFNADGEAAFVVLAWKPRLFVDHGRACFVEVLSNLRRGEVVEDHVDAVNKTQVPSVQLPIRK